MDRPDGIVNGHCAPAFERVARQFSAHFDNGQETGAGLCVYHRGEMVVDLWGGLAHPDTNTPWQADTLSVVFSVTKGLTAIALNLAAERGMFAWDVPVAEYWPGFAQGGKQSITVRQLFNHQAGLAVLSTPLTVAQYCDPQQRLSIRRMLEQQSPAEPVAQAYHALTFGMYADHFFEVACGERVDAFLHREWLDPLEADVFMGTPAAEDHRVASLLPVGNGARLGQMLWAAIRGGSTEANIARSMLRGGPAGRALTNPSGSMADYNAAPARRCCLPWASATATARGLARAYLPWSVGGQWQGRSWVTPATIEQVTSRQSWSERDMVLGKPLGWSQGFLKEERGLFSPNQESFGHPGIGGPLGWCDPAAQLAIGYTLNRSDWRVRSPRALALCAAIYECVSTIGPP
jgi:CubicO group peptidase (beta-lactamase class C family)